MGEMKLVFLLGVFSLLALSSTADTETSHTALDRRVRQTSVRRDKKGPKRGSKNIRGRKGKGKKSTKRRGLNEGKGRKRKGGKIKKSTKRKGFNTGQRKGKKGGKKSKNAKGDKGKRKKVKKNNRGNINQRNDTTTANCKSFLSFDNLKDLRYAQNQLRMNIRINNMINKLDNKRDKSADAFKAAAKFFKSCPVAEGTALYDILSQCNVTASAACNVSLFFEENAYTNFQYLYDKIDDCYTILNTTAESGKLCIHKCPDDENNVCDYKPVPRDDDYKRVCNYEEFEKALKKFNRKCFDAKVQGTFSNCTSLLKDSYDTAIECCSAVNSTTTPPTTTKSYVAGLLKLRKFNDFKSWK